MDAIPTPDPARISDLVAVAQAFRERSQVFSVGAAVLFLKLVEAGGAAEIDAVARETGIPFSQACRFADNLAEGVTRNVSGLGLAVRDERPGVRPARYALTEAGWDLAMRIGAARARPAIAA